MSQNVPLPKKSLLAFALASGKSATDVANEFGISRKTVQRQLAKPEFRLLVSRLRDELISGALGRMANTMSEAADTLASQLKKEESGIQIKAARAILVLGLRLRESVDLSNRIQVLESDMANREATS